MSRPNGQEHPAASVRARGHGTCQGCGERFALKTGTMAAIVRAGHVGWTLDSVCPSCAKNATPLVVASPRVKTQAELAPFASHLRHLGKLYERSTKADGRHLGFFQAADILDSGRLDALEDPAMPAVRAPDPPAPHKRPPFATSLGIPVPSDPRTDAQYVRVSCATPYAQKLLGVLASRHPEATSRTQLAVLARVSRRSSTFDGAIRALREAGLLAGSTAALLATAEGLAFYGPTHPFPKGEAVISAWVERVGEYAGSLLEILTTAHPSELSRAELAERAGVSPTSSTFDGALRKLRQLGLVVGLRASDSLMAIAQGKGR